MDLFEIIHLDRQVWTGVPDPPSLAMLICGAVLASAANVKSTEIHDEAQAQDAGVEALGALDILGGNVGHNSLDRHRTLRSC